MMKLSIFAAFAALFTTSVVTMPAPDPSHWEVVLSLDDMNAEDQPIRIAQPSSTSSSTVLPTPTTTQEVQVFLFTLPTPPPNVFSIPIPVPLDGKPIPLSKTGALVTIYHLAISGAAAFCNFSTETGEFYKVTSRRYSGSKEIYYGPAKLKTVACFPLKEL